MTLLEVEELTRYWIDHPPLHLMVAAYLGFGKEQHKRRGPPDVSGGAGAEVGHLLAELGPNFAGRDVHAGLRPVVLDFSELRQRAKTPD